MLALEQAFLHFKQDILDHINHSQCTHDGVKHMIIIKPVTDNKGVSDIMKWGSRIPKLNRIVRRLWNQAWENNFIWKVIWVPRAENVLADILSKALTFSIVLNPEAFNLCFLNKRLTPSCQAFCDREGVIPQVNHKLWHMSDPGGIPIDFLTSVWDIDEIPLATPPWHHMSKVLAHLRNIARKASIVCPVWTGATWWPLLMSMKVWAWQPPSNVPMFAVVGSGMPCYRPHKLRFPSRFFFVNGALCTHSSPGFSSFQARSNTQTNTL